MICIVLITVSGSNGVFKGRNLELKLLILKRLIQRCHFGFIYGLTVNHSELLYFQIVDLIHVLGKFLHKGPDFVIVVILEHFQLGNQKQLVKQFPVFFGQVHQEGNTPKSKLTLLAG